ncbi:PP2C family protein-serine/threonine phosphatase [Streptomyces lateritius]|uniref:PP2C family protein-serine/threonine phosphatase n=1 Tax=Streptomyces lateritius TaxID=67313 RepID=UPI0016719178|nr:PP2C family protein-serine/threonine phosphatase [Streptomyces lateritius]GGT76588.1 membrane protein [Streptomyces lateritius]
MIRTRSLLSDGSRLRRPGPLALPALWGAVAVTWKLGCPMAQQPGLAMRIATSVVFFTVGTGLILGIRRGLSRELERMRAIAHATQMVLLRPPPPRLDGLAVAAGQLSASRGAVVGGDLYEAVATPHGVRVVIGDVRGHGLAALGAVVAVLGSFREAAHDEPELGGVLRRLDRALGRHLRERAREEHPACAGREPREPEHPVAEEFVTLLLLEIRPDGEVYGLNCGHPGPYRIDRRVEPVPVGDPLPPLGAFPLPADLTPYPCTRLLPGESLFLHTDGAEDARDGAGRFFGLQAVLTEAAHDAPVAPAALVRRVHTALLRHTRGRLSDDVALLVVRNDRPRVPAQPAEPGLRRTRPAPSTHW